VRERWVDLIEGLERVSERERWVDLIEGLERVSE